MSDRAPDAPLDLVEWRVQGKIDRGGGVQVVAYLDGPTVSKLLDEWVGPARWYDRYELTGKAGSMWCHLSVKFDDEWITKVDLGTASDMEADKGLVSDAFKRVAMRKWRIGANVFDLPILRLTKFRQVDRPGKEPAAYLTGESQAEIQQQLRTLGFADAADQTRVPVREAPAPESAPAKKATKKAASRPEQKVTAGDNITAIWRTVRDHGIPNEVFLGYVADTYNVEDLAGLDAEQRTELVHALTQGGLPEQLGAAA